MVEREDRVNIKEVISPESMSDQELGGYLGAIGTRESKAIALAILATHPHEILPRLRIAKLLSQAQQVDPGQQFDNLPEPWFMSEHVLQQYCVDSFMNIGLVSQEVTDKQGNKYGYAITSRGKDKGLGLAGILLDLSDRHNIPLYHLFGNAGSSAPSTKIATVDNDVLEARNRQPLMRYLTMRNLASVDGVIHTEKLKEEVGMGEYNFSNILTDLSRAGLVNYQFKKPKESVISYHIPENMSDYEYSQFKTYKTLSKQVWEFLQEHGGETFSPTAFAESFALGASPKEIRYFSSHIAPILKYYTEIGTLKSDNPNPNETSDISVTSEQKALLQDIVRRIEKFRHLDADAIKWGERRAAEILADPIKIRELLQRSRTSSPDASPTGEALLKTSILEILKNSGGPTTRREIQQQLSQESIRASIALIGKYVRLLEEEGVIQKQKISKNLNRWLAVPKAG